MESTSRFVDYMVQPGDTLWSIAVKFNTTLDALSALNPHINPSVLYVGQRIRIPSNDTNRMDTICWYDDKRYSPGSVITITTDGEKLKCTDDGTWASL
ncbi:MAG: DUF1496 domain-containing protein [Bacillota bacterium]